MNGWKNSQTWLAHTFLEEQISEAQGKGLVITPKLIESLLMARIKHALKEVADPLPFAILNYVIRDIDFEALANSFGPNRPN